MSTSMTPSYNTSGVGGSEQRDQGHSYMMDEYLRGDGPVSERLSGAAKTDKNSKGEKKGYKDKAKGHIEHFDRTWDRNTGKEGK